MDINNYNNFKPSTHNINGDSYNKKRSFNNNFSVNDAFSEKTPFIERDLYQNTNTTLHNNLGNMLQLEAITEYHINIDSCDRNIETYPDSYNYVVSFNALGKSTEKKFEKKFAGTFGETPAPVIERNFKNVKYIRLDRVILSRNNYTKFSINQNILVDKNNIEVEIDCDKINSSKSSKEYVNICNERIKEDVCDVCCLKQCDCSISEKNKCIIIKFKELDNDHIYSTNTLTSDNSFFLYVDKSLGNSNNIWNPIYSSSIYQNSLLYNLNRLTVEYFNGDGTPMSSKIIIEYKLNIMFNGISIKKSFLLLFGNIDKNINTKIKNYNPDHIIILLKLNDIKKTRSWFDKIFSDMNFKSVVEKQFISFLIKNTKPDSTSLYIEKIYDSFKDIDIQNKYKYHSSNNVFIAVGVYENELNTLINYN